MHKPTEIGKPHYRSCGCSVNRENLDSKAYYGFTHLNAVVTFESGWPTKYPAPVFSTTLNSHCVDCAAPIIGGNTDSATTRNIAEHLAAIERFDRSKRLRSCNIV